MIDFEFILFILLIIAFIEISSIMPKIVKNVENYFAGWCRSMKNVLRDVGEGMAVCFSILIYCFCAALFLPIAVVTRTWLWDEIKLHRNNISK